MPEMQIKKNQFEKKVQKNQMKIPDFRLKTKTIRIQQLLSRFYRSN